MCRARQSLTEDATLSNILTPVPPVELPELIGGKYRPRSVLGFGATGTVYCVEHTFTGDLLALKVLQPHLAASPDAITRFKGEARTAAKLRSRHVVRIFDADVARELGGAPYLVMELLEGANLENAAGDKPAEPELVVGWLREAASPLQRAHQLGIVHRDLKPENLFLTTLDDGSQIVKILDFGIARIAESPGMTKSGQLFGTPLYMAPEQARGDIELIGPATDIFAFGMIAYRLLTGSEYRAEAGLAQMLLDILNEPLRTPSEKGHSLGVAFDQWFLKACDPNPQGRFASVGEQVESLAAALGVSRGSAAPPSSVRDPAEPPRASWAPRTRTEVGISPESVGSTSSLRPTTMATTGANGWKLETIPTLSGADVQDASPTPNGWRLGFFAMCVVAALGVGVGSWRKTSTATLASPGRPMDCPVGVIAPSSGTTEVPAVSPAPLVVALASAASAAPEPVKAATAANRALATDVVRPALARPAPRKPNADDDPLSDQK